MTMLLMGLLVAQASSPAAQSRNALLSSLKLLSANPAARVEAAKVRALAPATIDAAGGLLPVLRTLKQGEPLLVMIPKGSPLPPSMKVTDPFALQVFDQKEHYVKKNGKWMKVASKPDSHQVLVFNTATLSTWPQSLLGIRALQMMYTLERTPLNAPGPVNLNNDPKYLSFMVSLFKTAGGKKFDQAVQRAKSGGGKYDGSFDLGARDDYQKGYVGHWVEVAASR